MTTREEGKRRREEGEKRREEGKKSFFSKKRSSPHTRLVVIEGIFFKKNVFTTYQISRNCVRESTQATPAIHKKKDKKEQKDPPNTTPKTRGWTKVQDTKSVPLQVAMRESTHTHTHTHTQTQTLTHTHTHTTPSSPHTQPNLTTKG
jgi:hypothetical protein